MFQKFLIVFLWGIFLCTLSAAPEPGLLLYSSFDKYNTTPDYHASAQIKVGGIAKDLQLRMFPSMKDDGNSVCLNNKDTERLEHVFANIQWKKNEIGEFVIHPATECDSPYFGKIVDRRIREYELFTSDKTRKLIEKNNLKLITYESV